MSRARRADSAVQELIEDTLEEQELDYTRHTGAHGGLPGLVVELPGERRLKTNTHPVHRRALGARRGVRLPQARREPRGRLPVPAEAQPQALRRRLHPRQRRRHLPRRPDGAGRRSPPTRSTACSARCSRPSTRTSTPCWSWVFAPRSRRNGSGGSTRGESLKNLEAFAHLIDRRRRLGPTAWPGR